MQILGLFYTGFLIVLVYTAVKAPSVRLMNQDLLHALLMISLLIILIPYVLLSEVRKHARIKGIEKLLEARQVKKDFKNATIAITLIFMLLYSIIIIYSWKL